MQEIEELKCVKYFQDLILKKMENRCFVAGGALRDYYQFGHVKSDIDLYAYNKIDVDWCIKKIQNLGFYFIFANDKVITMRSNDGHIFQLIKQFTYKELADAVYSFDFTVCSAAVDDKGVVYHPRFFLDLCRHRLVINSLPYPLSTLGRLRKYFKKGFTICNGGLLEIAKAIKQIDFSDPNQNIFEMYPDGTTKFVGID